MPEAPKPHQDEETRAGEFNEATLEGTTLLAKKHPGPQATEPTGSSIDSHLDGTVFHPDHRP